MDADKAMVHFRSAAYVPNCPFPLAKGWGHTLACMRIGLYIAGGVSYLIIGFIVGHLMEEALSPGREGGDGEDLVWTVLGWPFMVTFGSLILFGRFLRDQREEARRRRAKVTHDEPQSEPGEASPPSRLWLPDDDSH